MTRLSLLHLHVYNAGMDAWYTMQLALYCAVMDKESRAFY